MQVTPETENSHFAFTGLFRNFNIQSEALTESMYKEFVEVVLQDMDIIEHQQRNHEVDKNPPRNINLIVDQASLEARRVIRRLHDEEKAKETAAPVHVSKPVSANTSTLMD